MEAVNLDRVVEWFNAVAGIVKDERRKIEQQIKYETNNYNV
jgi:hypothetical protein